MNGWRITNEPHDPLVYHSCGWLAIAYIHQGVKGIVPSYHECNKRTFIDPVTYTPFDNVVLVNIVGQNYYYIVKRLS